jgi:hypothetical protein
MSSPGSWRELTRCDDLAEAGAIATSIAAMEFDVRIRDLGTGVVIGDEHHPGVGHDGGAVDVVNGPCVIEARAEDWADLTDVLDQIVDEQGAFDAHLERRDDLARRARRLFMLLMIIIVSVLAVLGLVSL